MAGMLEVVGNLRYPSKVYLSVASSAKPRAKLLTTGHIRHEFAALRRLSYSKLLHASSCLQHFKCHLKNVAKAMQNVRDPGQRVE